MLLTGKQTKHLRSLAHSLDAIVTVGRTASDEGLSDGVVKETLRALDDHELIKVKLPAGDKKERRKLLDDLGTKTESAAVQLIGRIGVLYRPGESPTIKLPK